MVSGPLNQHMAPAPDVQLEAAWALTNIASGSSTHTRAVTSQGAIPVFAAMLVAPVEALREQVWP